MVTNRKQLLKQVIAIVCQLLSEKQNANILEQINLSKIKQVLKV